MTAPSVRRGRPRDPLVDHKVRAAAVDLFADAGWAGFSIERVAKRARVGKASIYLRWSSSEQLLVDALERELTFVTDHDTGTVRGDLNSLAHQLTDIYYGAKGRAYLRLNLEGEIIQGFDRYWDHQQVQMHIARGLIRRAVARGEIPATVRGTTVLDALSGGLLMHSLTVPKGPQRTLAARRRFATELVEFVLEGISRPAPSQGDGPPSPN